MVKYVSIHDNISDNISDIYARFRSMYDEYGHCFFKIVDCFLLSQI